MLNKPRNKASEFFKAFLPVLCIEGIQLYTSMVITFGYAFYLIGTIQAENVESFFDNFADKIMNMNYMMFILIAYAVISIPIFIFWYSGFNNDTPLHCGKYTYPSSPEKHIRSLSLKGYSPLLIISLPMLALGMQYVSNYIVSVIAVISPNTIEDYADLMERAGLSTGTLSIPLVLAVVVLGPIAEELALRGVSLGYASRALPFWAANLLQAGLFGLMHLNLVQGLYAFALGLVLGYVYHKCGNIIIPCILHMLYNGISTFVGDHLFFGEEKPIFFAFILFLSLCVSYGALMLTAWSLKGKKTA